MAVSQIVQSLEQLQQELQRLAPAVDHVEAASKVTSALAGIPEQHQEMINHLVSNHKSRIDELNGLVKAVSEKAESTLTVANQSHQKSLEDYQATTRSFVEEKRREVASYMKEIREIQDSFFSDLKAKLDNLQSTIKDESSATYEEMREETTRITELRSAIESYLQKVVAIDFPTRLEKLDATVSGIMAATQTTQGRVDNLERATSEKLTALTSAMEKQQTELMAAIAKANKSTRTLQIVSIVLSIIVLAAIAYLLIRS
jgi:hypothetical protein